MDYVDRKISTICTSLMRAVTASGVMTGHNDLDRATRIMREELKLLLLPSLDKKGKYVNEREVVLQDGASRMEAIVLGTVALECVQRITAERKAEAAKVLA